jgi:hypothetical protein
MGNSKTEWKSYEEVAQFLLNEMADKFGLIKVEDRQKITGQSTSWVIDAKGIAKEGIGFIIIECRRYTASKLNQESLGGLAYRIKDTKANGGIIVSPLGLQEGAKKVASANNIISVQLRENSTISNYILEFLNQVFVGFNDTVALTDEIKIKLNDTQVI